MQSREVKKYEEMPENNHQLDRPTRLQWEKELKMNKRMLGLLGALCCSAASAETTIPIQTVTAVGCGQGVYSPPSGWDAVNALNWRQAYLYPQANNAPLISPAHHNAALVIISPPVVNTDPTVYPPVYCVKISPLFEINGTIEVYVTAQVLSVNTSYFVLDENNRAIGNLAGPDYGNFMRKIANAPGGFNWVIR